MLASQHKAFGFEVRDTEAMLGGVSEAALARDHRLSVTGGRQRSPAHAAEPRGATSVLSLGRLLARRAARARAAHAGRPRAWGITVPRRRGAPKRRRPAVCACDHFAAISRYLRRLANTRANQ